MKGRVAQSTLPCLFAGGKIPSRITSRVFFSFCFLYQAEDGIRYLVRSRWLGDVYKRQVAYPDKPFHKLATNYGLTDTDFTGGHAVARDDSHTYINVDMSRCINCYACVRICADVQGQFVWHVLGPVSYTHLTLPTGDRVEVSVVGVTLKKKIKHR